MLFEVPQKSGRHLDYCIKFKVQPGQAVGLIGMYPVRGWVYSSDMRVAEVEHQRETAVRRGGLQRCYLATAALVLQGRMYVIRKGNYLLGKKSLVYVPPFSGCHTQGLKKLLEQRGPF